MIVEKEETRQDSIILGLIDVLRRERFCTEIHKRRLWFAKREIFRFGKLLIDRTFCKGRNV